jgi:GTP-binding protein HflX
MKKLYGNTAGLKPNQTRRLENLYRRRVPPEQLITPELARDIAAISFEIHRQIAVLINRQGRMAYVIVGNHKQIVIPPTDDYRAAPDRLKGIRCIHTHLQKETLTQDDLTDLAILRLDMMAAIEVSAEGRVHLIHAAHILPRFSDSQPYRVLPPLRSHELSIGCLDLILALESEMSRIGSGRRDVSGKERAILLSVYTDSRQHARESLVELKQLAVSCGIEVAGTIMQRRQKMDNRFVIGRGKLQDIIIHTLQEGATLIIFDQELNASQIRSITDLTDLKVIDRSQLILDIFAQRARSREGKLQVELAQLKYLLPRLVTKNTAMSRLTGGIGGRGPGETKLEINRRRARERISRLEAELERVRNHRQQQRSKRQKKGLPIISIIGYTNAGKSTLLNTLTKSNVLAESRLFATLDPSSRRLRFPRETDVIITDTVGFIRDLPQDLMVAFRATLEELESADLLLHVIDISSSQVDEQIESVESILADLNLHRRQTLRVLNKKDRVHADLVRQLAYKYKGIAISANQAMTLPPLIQAMESTILQAYRPDAATDDRPSQ